MSLDIVPSRVPAPAQVGSFSNVLIPLFSRNAKPVYRKLKGNMNALRARGRPKSVIQCEDETDPRSFKFTNARQETAYAWLHYWAQPIADEDPVGKQYHLVLDPVEISDVYNVSHFFYTGKLTVKKSW